MFGAVYNAGDTMWAAAKPAGEVPDGYEWTKIGEAITPVSTGGEIVSYQWKVKPIAVMVPEVVPSKVPSSFVVGLILTGLFLWVTRRA